MIKVSFNKNGISIKGHAKYARRGKDIYCAGVSTLAFTLIESIEALTQDEIEYVCQPGTVEIKHGNLSESAKLLIDFFFIGIKLIADNHPDYVQIV